MNWKLKAIIQNAVSLLPSSASYAAYYWIQRHFGALKQLNPVSRLTAGVETWERIERLGYNPSGKVFMEVGTGRVPLVPLAYWLMGAEKTITIDLNPYLKEELISESLAYISENQQKTLGLFGSLIDQERFNQLLEFNGKARDVVSEFLDLCQVEYIAPGDAAATRLADQSVDFHTSYTVFEHIPPKVLQEIIEEGNRIVRDDGLFIHRIDYSDHFSHSDKSISAVNFLRYSEDEWKRFADNKYMYMNRLRHDDFIVLFESAGHRILDSEPDVCQQLQKLLKRGDQPLHSRFSSKPEEVLATTGSWMVTQKKAHET